MLSLVNVIIRLIWSRFTVPFCKACLIKTTGYIVIIRLMLVITFGPVCPKVITFSGFYCIKRNSKIIVLIRKYKLTSYIVHLFYLPWHLHPIVLLCCCLFFLGGGEKLYKGFVVIISLFAINDAKGVLWDFSHSYSIGLWWVNRAQLLSSIFWEKKLSGNTEIYYFYYLFFMLFNFI